MSAMNPDGLMESPDGEIEAAAVAAGVPSICPANDDDAEAESGEAKPNKTHSQATPRT